MTGLTTLTVTRPANPPLFWPAGVNRLVVVVGPATYHYISHDVDCLIAYGFSDSAPTPVLVFRRQLPAEALGDFFKALVDGESSPPPDGTQPEDCYPDDGWWAPWIGQWKMAGALPGNPAVDTPKAYSVDIPNPQNPPTGPKLFVARAYAGSLFGVQGVAELDAFGNIDWVPPQNLQSTGTVAAHSQAESAVS